MEPTELSHQIAAIVRSQMGFKNISQAELVRATGMSQPTLSRLLKGDRAMDVEQLNIICKALRVSLGDVMTQAMEYVSNASARRGEGSVTQLHPPMSEDVSSLVERSAARNGKGNKNTNGDSTT